MSKARNLSKLKPDSSGLIESDDLTSAITINTLTAGQANFADNAKAIFGAGSDLQIYHDGSDSYIKDSGTGNLYLDSSDTIIRANGTENSAKFIGNGRVELYYDAVKKIETTSTGIDVTGDVGGDTLTISGAGSIQGLTVGRGAGAVASNTAVGASALAANTGNTNTATGYYALNQTTSGNENSGFGSQALYLNTTGIRNSAFGLNSLYNSTTGSSNTAMGASALYSNTTADNNTAVGYQALYANTTGDVNTAVGKGAMYSNTTGADNSALGLNSLYLNTSGRFNVAVGKQALNSNTTANNNTAVGYQAGYLNTTGAENVFVGQTAGYNNTTGTLNTFVGYNSGAQVTTGTKNSILGRYNGNQGGLDIRTSSNNIVLSDGDGNPRLWMNGSGNIFWGGIRANAGSYAIKLTTGGEQVFDTSSARYKDNIRDSVYGLSHVMQMRSAQFEYKDDGRSDVGFIAEEIVQVIPEVVVIDKQGRPDAVAYDRITSVLLKAIQEQQAIIESLKARLDAANL